ncbi:hypothetical protein N7499_008034 [Penicillium canescens]|uniref:AA1-like domain-containing protein n=1 Tax=Penicillium canescens TaxID=5083 RepID=A0AAD6N2D9_PENCN|nr:uncharacterized protein N7446_013070 [Penicillium canescens]KAJ6022719.1 hypothetical protein N7460_013114 [Penicillium canescens]KAJ6026019.1 hypothetical protein N7444_013698 [Penicillium canescens]KAJ6042004.1 hypothetical protein N7446_013070 [Penicillium canescens]KAJ6076053.1 hypothetical protein N7499_008034 [Penicillium canescens]KAJ6158364.1 hypothetical protein N7485_011190 [Penicillium canescens]
MKFIAASLLLAASSVFAAPANSKRENSISISDFRASATTYSSATMHFVVIDPNYPDDTPTDCNLIWSYGASPKQSARCNNGQYYIKFPDGAINFHSFTLELERVSGPIAEKGQVSLESGTKWTCVENPEDQVLIRCGCSDVLTMNI